MYVCMYIYIYVFVYIYIYMYMFLHVCVHDRCLEQVYKVMDRGPTFRVKDHSKSLYYSPFLKNACVR